MVNNSTSMIDGDEKVWEMVKDIGIQMCLQGPKVKKMQFPLPLYSIILQTLFYEVVTN